MALWTWRFTSGTRDWWCLVSSSDGTKLVAAEPGDGGGYIYTSTDSGVTWTERTGAGAFDWQALATSSDCSKLVAGAFSGYIYTSTDSGANWTERTGAGSRNWRDAASSSDGSKLAACVNGGYIYTSTDSGVNWTQQTGSGSRNWIAVTSSSDGSKLAACEVGGYIYTSTDSGVNWTQQTGSGVRNWYGIASSSDGSKLAASEAGGYTYTSTDSGANWTEQTGSGIRDWRCIASSTDGSNLVAGAYSGYIYVSTDSGVNWTEQASAGTNSWYKVTSSSDGSKLSACDNGGSICTNYGDLSAFTSPTFIAFTDAGLISISNDGASWPTGASLPVTSTGSFFGQYLLGAFYIFDTGSSTYYKSVDGTTWSTESFPTITNPRCAAASSTTICVASPGDTVFATSTDGETWTETSLPALSWPYETIASDGSKFCMINIYVDTVMTSTDGVSWTESALVLTGVHDYVSIAWNGNVFAAVCKSTAPVAIYSSNGSSWTEVSISPVANNQSPLVTKGSTFCISCVDGSTNGVITSTNGITWSFAAAGDSSTNSFVSSDGEKFVISGNGGEFGSNQTVHVSTDGTTWVDYATALAAEPWISIIGAPAPVTAGVFWTDYVKTLETDS